MAMPIGVGTCAKDPFILLLGPLRPKVSMRRRELEGLGERRSGFDSECDLGPSSLSGDEEGCGEESERCEEAGAFHDVRVDRQVISVEGWVTQDPEQEIIGT